MKYSCDRCDFVDALVVRPEAAFYVTEEEEDILIPLYHRLAWCQNCQTVTYAEELISSEEIKEKIATIRRNHIRRDFENYLTFLEQRQSSPRCLRCGGTEITYASSDHSLVHPVCGGVLSGSISPIRIHNRSLNLYSFDGKFLAAVDNMDDWRSRSTQSPS